jgi:hypothetical protein
VGSNPTVPTKLMSNKVNHRRSGKVRAQRSRRSSNLVNDPRRDIGRNHNDQLCHSEWKKIKTRIERRRLKGEGR